MSYFGSRSRYICLVLGILAVVFGKCGIASADLWTDGGFEGSLGWTGSDTFVGETATAGAAVNGATFFTLVHDDLITESGTWIEDSTRAFEGDRMFWLRDYDDPDTICVGHRFTGILEAGVNYQLKFNFAAFDPDTPGGTTSLVTKPIAEVMHNDGTGNVIEELPVSFSNGDDRDPDAGTYAEFAVSNWNNLQWFEATVNFVAPEDNGQPVYIWASMTNDSAGMLLDGISLVAVPEPTTAGLLLALLTVVGTQRRRRA
jgi:hypothetical protein